MSRVITIAAALLCLGGAASFARSEGGTKSLALDFTLCTAAIALTSETTDTLNKSEQNNKIFEIESKLSQQIEKLETEAKDRIISLSNTKKLCDTQAQELSTKSATIEAFERQILTVKNQFERKTDELNYKLSLDDTRYTQTIARFRKALIEDMRSRIKDEYNQIFTYIIHKLELQDDEGNFKHAAIHKPLQKLKSDLEAKFPQHCDELYEINALPDDESVLAGIEIYSRVCAEIANFKGRYKIIFSADRVHEADRLAEELEDVYTNLSAKFTPKNKAIETLNEYHQASNEKLKNLLPKLDENDQSLAELHAQVSDLVDQIDLGNLKIANLNQQIEELSKPLQFFGVGAIALAGNAISAHYYKYFKYRLDAINWTETETGYELLYAIRNNPGLSAEELYQGNTREQLASFTNSLKGTLPEFEFNYQNCTLTLKVTLRRAAKKDNSKNDIDKIWVSASKFESYVKNWERVRITAGSTGGKSPTAKNLALAIMSSRKGVGEIRLYDPQDGSKKDYWNMPKSGTSHEDNLAGMTELCSLIDQRRGTKNNPFVLYLFDEVDNTVSQLNEGVKFRDLVKVSLKESSHADIGVIYIGQSADANEVPGMTHSNWGNAIQLHIGSNAGSWIDSAKTITTEDKTRLLEQYRKIQEFCDHKNEELGLDIFTDATAYRFALAVPLTGLPKFIQLPDFDTYDYYEVMSTSSQNETFPNNIESSFVELKFEESTQEIGCPKCGSINIGSKGDDFNRCRECGKTWAKPKIDLGF